MSSALTRCYRDLHAFALGLPEAWEDHPWGEVVVKVRRKIFVFFGRDPAKTQALGFSVKLPESAADVLRLPGAKPTGYGLGKSGWVTIEFAPSAAIDLELARGWILESYCAVAPKTLSSRITDH